jgi:hypothetical protein
MRSHILWKAMVSGCPVTKTTAMRLLNIPKEDSNTQYVSKMDRTSFKLKVSKSTKKQEAYPAVNNP